MQPLPPHDEKKSRSLLLVGIIAIAVIILIVAAVGYMYLDDRNQKREKLKQTFSDQRDETDRLYALISSYKAADNKNELDGFRNWIDGYRTLADNYSQAVALLVANAGEYQGMLSEGTDEYSDVSVTCSRANQTLKSINDTIAGYEREYQSRLGMKNEVYANYELAINQSLAQYDSAWKLMQDSANFKRYGGYLAFLATCEKNNTRYNDSITLVRDLGAIYQRYLNGNDYYAVNWTILDLHDKYGNLSKKYDELSKVKPVVNLIEKDVTTAASVEKGLYKIITFVLENENRRNETLPMKIWNVVVHYSLVNSATGDVRSTCDVPVTVTNYYMTDDHFVTLPCDQKANYTTAYTISFEY